SGSHTEQALDRVTREAERLNELVAELLAMTREEIHRAPVNVAALLADIVDQIQIEAQARPCRLVLDATPDLEAPADARVVPRAGEKRAPTPNHPHAPRGRGAPRTPARRGTSGNHVPSPRPGRAASSPAAPVRSLLPRRPRPRPPPRGRGSRPIHRPP